MAARPFSVAHRAADVADVAADELDVLVVGMGATGAGVALDAASRGMSVAVVDKGDLASGTSSKSSKLIHGGLRYLENYELALVHEGVTERQTLMRLAPHLVRPMDFLYPVWPDTARRRLLGVGLTTYDVLAGARGVRRHERITSAEAIARAPALDCSGLDYAYVYGDSATDDARLVLAVTQAARRFGAVALTHTEVVDVVRDAAGTLRGTRVRDRLTGDEYDVRARHVVNATGVWVDRLLGLADPGRSPAVQPSKGVHLVVPHERLPLDDTSVIMPSKQGDGRSMFAIAWGRQTILGTTDTAYADGLDELALTEDDLAYVLAAGNAVFGRDLTGEDVVAAWVGVRPLMRPAAGGGDAAAMSDISRRHVVLEDPSGLVTVTGGKLTTYRRMAADAVDVLVGRDGRRARSRTDEIPLGCSRPLADVVADTVAAAATLGIAEETAKLLVRGHGEAAVDVLSLVAADPAYGDVLAPESPYLLAEVAYAAQREGAATLDDVLSRRTRVALRVRDAGLPMARRAAGILAEAIGRDGGWIDEQVGAYVDAVGRERGPLGRPGAVAPRAR